ncbi:MAG: four helix bundle protein [Candidatus Peribacteraceae bacterium]|nr:four helix bundle protein [Candidatus Peribacteraceae bacterium]
MNIAEGNAKRTPNHKCQFFEIALGSLEELHCQARIAKDLKYITPEEFSKTDEKINRVSYLLTRLRASFKK